MDSEEEILDLPEHVEEPAKDYKFLRHAAMASFLLALIARADSWDLQPVFILVGTVLFTLWSVLRFASFSKRKLHEWFYFPARILLMVGLAVRYADIWKYDFVLVLASLLIFLIGYIVSLRQD